MLFNNNDDDYKPSFFDDSDSKDYVIWRKAITNQLKKFSDIRLYEGLLFKKSTKSNFFKSRYYVLYEDRLAYYKNNRETKELCYCTLSNMRLEKIPYTLSEKEERYGLRLKHNGQYTDLYARTKDQQDKWINKLKQFCIMTNYSSQYINIKIIGKGSFAKVFLVKKKADNTDLAVKTFSKNTLETTEKAKASLINEINIMRRLDHESIIKLYEVHENDSYIYLVVELLKGGELFDRILKKGAYTEKEACMLMKKLLSSLDHIHSKGIMHRDLKLENLILKDNDNDYDIKLADFGLAAFVNPNGEYLFKRCGTPGYVAPEILNDEKYDQKVDVFSAGVIFYILLTGSSPFHGKSYNEILIKNKNCEVKFNFKDSSIKISEQAIDLMKKMLEKNPTLRYTARDCLESEWIRKNGEFGIISQVPSNAQENMKKFQEEYSFSFIFPELFTYHLFHLDKIRHRFNVRNIKPKGLEPLVSASPVINGKLISYNDSGNMNSPQRSSNNTTNNNKCNSKVSSTTGRNNELATIPQDDNDDQLDENNIINSNMNKYQIQGVNLITSIKNSTISSYSSSPSSITNTPKLMSIPNNTNNAKNTKKIQQNLLSYIKEIDNSGSTEFTYSKVNNNNNNNGMNSNSPSTSTNPNEFYYQIKNSKFHDNYKGNKMNDGADKIRNDLLKFTQNK